LPANYTAIQSTNPNPICCIVNSAKGWNLVEYKEEKWTHPDQASEDIVPRATLIVTLSHSTSKKTIKVANLHLCGGRFDEVYVNQDPKCSDAEYVANIKNGLIRTALNNEPDVIVGDFNSDVVCYGDEERKYVQGPQLGFWGSLSPEGQDEEVIKARLMVWNCAPFDLLKQSGYVLAGGDASTINEFKEHGTSKYGSTPDAIWYSSKSGWRMEEFHRVCLMSNANHTNTKTFTDHDALVASFI